MAQQVPPARRTGTFCSSKLWVYVETASSEKRSPWMSTHMLGPPQHSLSQMGPHAPGVWPMMLVQPKAGAPCSMPPAWTITLTPSPKWP